MHLVCVSQTHTQCVWAHWKKYTFNIILLQLSELPRSFNHIFSLCAPEDVCIRAIAGVKSAKSLWSNHLNFRVQRNFLETDASWITRDRSEGGLGARRRGSTKPDDYLWGGKDSRRFLGGQWARKSFMRAPKVQSTHLGVQSKNMSCEWDC